MRGLMLREAFWATKFREMPKTNMRSTLLMFCVVLLISTFLSARWIESMTKTTQSTKSLAYTKKFPEQATIPFTCPSQNQTHICSAGVRESSLETRSGATLSVCPDYFRWIFEDLRPWRDTGITRDMVERGRRTANFRLVIVNGRAYIERYQKSFQSRDVFTLWGILQLLRRYPGQLPDLDLMFDCVDWPIIKLHDYQGSHVNKTDPPPLFRYCGDDETLDIVFPDWSFWACQYKSLSHMGVIKHSPSTSGPEINVKPWESLLKELMDGNARIKWLDRVPYAYWKGNPSVASIREELLKCNVSNEQDWSARIYTQDWLAEIQTGFKQSDLASQCNYRYKIYIEGSAWSVSQKYILACDSVTLIVKPQYYDFFTRGLMPVHHYWPVRNDDKCKSIKFAVSWGNRHKQKAQAIGKAASSFIREELKMDYVYDYMFHLLSEYARLLRYQPTIPPKALELCSESMACPARGLEMTFMMDSLVKVSPSSGPCKLPPPFDTVSLYSIIRRKENSIRQVEIWEKQAWESQNKA